MGKERKGDNAMGEYHRLDLGKLIFSNDIISQEEALKDITPFELEESVLSGQKKINITKAEKDYKNKCVKLEIFC